MGRSFCGGYDGGNISNLGESEAKVDQMTRHIKRNERDIMDASKKQTLSHEKRGRPRRVS